MIKRAVEDEDQIVRVYEPLRYAVVAEAQNPGRGLAVLNRKLPELDNMRYAESLKKHNVIAFQRFCTDFSSNWPTFGEHYLDSRKQLSPVSLGSHEISGRFHFSALTPKGRRQFVYVCASEHDSDTIFALRELLAIIGEQRHDCDRNQVVLLDLNVGAMHLPHTSYLNTRKKLESVLTIGSLIEKEYRKRAA